MKYNRKKAFTLTEVLIAAGILAVGFMLIAGAFPVGTKLTAIATERTIGATATQEAIAKIRLHGIDMNNLTWAAIYNNTDGITYGSSFSYSRLASFDWSLIPSVIPDGFQPVLPTAEDYYYPTTNLVAEKKYHWSALCKRIGIDEVLVTVFVSRVGLAGAIYPTNPVPVHDTPGPIDRPEPYMIQDIIRDSVNSDELEVPDGYATYFREGSIIYDDVTGQVYTIMELTPAVAAEPAKAKLDRPWPHAGGVGYHVWVIPSQINLAGTALTGRWPGVWVFQEKVKFQNFNNIVAVP